MHNINILIPNYNNGMYLEECLKSVFAQKGIGPFLVFINDDKSTDNSLEIIQKYLNMYPDKLILLKNTNNMGNLYTTLQLYKKVNSIYFTVLDGDDFWLDNKFLARAIRFLNQREDFSIYSENTKILYENNIKVNYWKEEIKISGFDKKTNEYKYECPHTSSTVFRNNLNNDLINKLEQIANDINKGWKFKLREQIYEGDFFRNAYFSDSKIMCNYNKFAGCYRIRSSNSRWNSLSSDHKNILNLFANYEITNTFSNEYKKQYFLNIFLTEKNKINIPDKIMYYNFKITKNDIIEYISQIEKNKNTYRKIDADEDEYYNIAPIKFWEKYIRKLKEINTDKLVEIDADKLVEIDANELVEIDANELVEIDADELVVIDADELVEIDANELVEIDANELEQIETDELVEIDANELVKIDSDELQQIDTDELEEIDADKLDQIETEEIEEIDADKLREKNIIELVEIETNKLEKIDSDKFEEIDVDDCDNNDNKPISEQSQILYSEYDESLIIK